LIKEKEPFPRSQTSWKRLLKQTVFYTLRHFNHCINIFAKSKKQECSNIKTFAHYPQGFPQASCVFYAITFLKSDYKEYNSSKLISVKQSVLYRLGYMLTAYLLLAVKVGNGAGKLEQFIISAGRKSQFIVCGTKYRLSLSVGLTEHAHHSGGKLSI
jgi:hypothetical protein